jgi:hypothetical protein
VEMLDRVVCGDVEGDEAKQLKGMVERMKIHS